MNIRSLFWVALFAAAVYADPATQPTTSPTTRPAETPGEAIDRANAALKAGDAAALKEVLVVRSKSGYSEHFIRMMLASQQFRDALAGLPEVPLKPGEQSAAIYVMAPIKPNADERAFAFLRKAYQASDGYIKPIQFGNSPVGLCKIERIGDGMFVVVSDPTELPDAELPTLTKLWADTAAVVDTMTAEIKAGRLKTRAAVDRFWSDRVNEVDLPKK